MNNNPCHLSEHDWNALSAILKRYPARYYLFGSRAKGTQTDVSDVDLCYEGEIDEVSLRDDLDNSNIGVFVDLRKRSKIAEPFLRLIEPDFRELRFDASPRSLPFS